MGGGRFRLDRLRLPWRTDTLQVALYQFAVRHCRYVRVPEGLLLLLQGVVAPEALAAPVPALELGRAGWSGSSRVGLLQPGRGGTTPRRQEPRQPEGSAARPPRVEGEIRAGRTLGPGTLR